MVLLSSPYRVRENSLRGASDPRRDLPRLRVCAFDRAGENSLAGECQLVTWLCAFLLWPEYKTDPATSGILGTRRGLWVAILGFGSESRERVLKALRLEATAFPPRGLTVSLVSACGCPVGLKRG